MSLEDFISKYYLLFIIIIIAVVGLYFLANLFTSLQDRNRIINYSLNDNVTQESISILDALLNQINSCLNRLTRLLNKSKLFNKIAKRYKKINIKDQENTYYLAIKILNTLVFALLYIVISICYDNFNVILLPIVILISYFIPDLIFIYNYNKYILIVKKNFFQSMVTLNNLFKSNLTISEAFKSLSINLEGPLQKEYTVIVKDLEYGLSIEESLNRFNQRINLEEIKYLSEALKIVNLTGGNLTEVFDNVIDSLANRRKLDFEIKKITSLNRICTKIFILLPLIVSIIIILLNPKYYQNLFGTPTGILVLAVIIVIYILYILIVRKALKVKLQ